MKPLPLILRPIAFANGVPAVATPVQRRILRSTPGRVTGAFQHRTQSVLNFLVGTLLKTW